MLQSTQIYKQALLIIGSSMVPRVPSILLISPGIVSIDHYYNLVTLKSYMFLSPFWLYIQCCVAQLGNTISVKLWLHTSFKFKNLCLDCHIIILRFRWGKLDIGSNDLIHISSVNPLIIFRDGAQSLLSFKFDVRDYHRLYTTLL